MNKNNPTDVWKYLDGHDVKMANTYYRYTTSAHALYYCYNITLYTLHDHSSTVMPRSSSFSSAQ